MFQNKRDREFQRKRAKLTKLWFVLLGFNILINLDGLAFWVSESDETSSQVVVTGLECSSKGLLQTYDPLQQSLQKFASIPITVLQQTSTKAVAAPFPVATIFEKTFWVQPLPSQIPFISRDPSRASGLSPPV